MSTAANVLSPFFYFCCFSMRNCAINWCDKLCFFCIYICCFIANFCHMTRWGSKQSHGHRAYMTSSVTWPFDFQGPISYRHNIVTKSLSPAVSEIMGTKHIGVMTLTFQGHVTSSVTWPLDSGWVISYWWSFGPKSLSLAISEIFRPKHDVLIDTMLNRHCACAYHVTCTPM